MLRMTTILAAMLLALTVSGCMETDSSAIDTSATSNCPNRECNGINGVHFMGGAPGY